MNLAITSIAWVESIVKTEVQKLWYAITDTRDRIVFIEWDDSAIARLNLWSRVGNRVYLELAKRKVKDFDQLFDLLQTIDWRTYCGKWNPFVVDAVSDKSILNSIPAIQKIWFKSVVTKITWSRDVFYNADVNLPKIEILLFIQDDICRVLLNTTWEAMHKRGYRLSTHEAPIKESLAAALVILSSWNFKKPLYDFFCGSGTIVIEAALLAKNIAPWSLWRKFAFEHMWWYDKKYLIDALAEAKTKEYLSWSYEIYWSDILEENIELSKENAKKAGVLDMIKFKKAEISDFANKTDLNWTLVSNPPYGLRLNDSSLPFIYKDLAKIFRNNPSFSWWLITSYEEFDSMININNFKKRKLYNWSERCYFYKKIL